SPCESRSSSRLNFRTPFAKADGVLFLRAEKPDFPDRIATPTTLGIHHLFACVLNATSAAA
ncbi:hypothetical protein, partial [Pseudomonas bohemica]|uniref:hypothetical protein n=1 Tax=Pseudomonas bohemica TaxID=2044872 RepID=UPI001F252235